MEERLTPSMDSIDSGYKAKDHLDMFNVIAGSFHMAPQDIRTYSPLTLAFIGDGIYECIIRTLVVLKGNTAPGKLQKKSSGLAKAAAQAEIMKVLLPELTEKELAVYKSGRNAKPYTKAKNATMGEYHIATGFECLMGYLYLLGEQDRMLKLIKKGLEETGNAL